MNSASEARGDGLTFADFQESWSISSMSDGFSVAASFPFPAFAFDVSGPAANAEVARANISRAATPDRPRHGSRRRDVDLIARLRMAMVASRNSVHRIICPGLILRLR